MAQQARHGPQATTLISRAIWRGACNTTRTTQQKGPSPLALYIYTLFKYWWSHVGSCPGQVLLANKQSAKGIQKTKSASAASSREARNANAQRGKDPEFSLGEPHSSANQSCLDKLVYLISRNLWWHYFLLCSFGLSTPLFHTHISLASVPISRCLVRE